MSFETDDTEDMDILRDPHCKYCDRVCRGQVAVLRSDPGFFCNTDCERKWRAEQSK